MKQKIKDAVLGATGKALATSGPWGTNVVPVSAVQIVDDKIHLYDFFMYKTAENIKEENQVALACWDGLAGIQIKAEATYLNEGDAFDTADQWAKETYPDRTLRGLIVLKLLECYSAVAAPDSGMPIALED